MNGVVLRYFSPVFFFLPSFPAYEIQVKVKVKVKESSNPYSREPLLPFALDARSHLVREHTHTYLCTQPDIERGR